MGRIRGTLTVQECLTANLSDGRKLGFGDSSQEIGESSSDTDIVIDTDHERAQAEISASIRTLKTNLVMITAFVLLLVLYLKIQSWTTRVVIMAFYKGLVPIITTIANFGKIRSVLAMYYKNFDLCCFNRA